MDSASDSQTSASLLAQLRQDPTNAAAWATFVARYGPKVHRWCRQAKLQEADAEDVTQEVLVRLAQKMKTFAYDPARSFRGWLRTLTQHAWSDFVKRRKKAGQGSGDSELAELLDNLAARDELLAQLEAEFDQEILETATVRVRLRVQPHTWDAYRLTALEGLSGAAAAQQLGMRVGTVFNAKNKVHKMLQEEVRKLDEVNQ